MSSAVSHVGKFLVRLLLVVTVAFGLSALTVGAVDAHAARVAFAAEVAASRTQVLAAQRAEVADRDMMRTYLEQSRLGAAQQASALRTAQYTARDQAVAVAQAALAASDGKAASELRTQLSDAANALASATLFTPIQAGVATVADLTNQVSAQVAAYDAEQARIAAEAAAKAAAATRSSSSGSARTATSSSSSAGAGSSSASVQEVAESTLRSLPNNDIAVIEWSDPDGSLGGVYLGTRTILLNPDRLAGNPAKTQDVVKHEIAHVYQGVVMQANGWSVSDLSNALSDAFGSNGIEKSADCVALHFGASWVNYTRDCGGDAKQAWVNALIEGRTP